MTRLRPYAQLVRLPNLPTPLADIALAGLTVNALGPANALSRRWPAFILLMLASACLYMGGMVWNDFFDIEQDARERPERPIPSGRVSRRTAGILGAALLAAGVLLALLAGQMLALLGEEGSRLLPGILAGLLVAAILLYDGWLKRTWLGPVAMGSCRFLNVLMGISLSGSLAAPLGTHLALVVGLYIVGVTWFARTEARTSSKPALAGAAAVMLAAVILAVPLPVHRPVDSASPLFPYLLVAFGFLVGLPVSRAIAAPAPENVQAGVKRALIGLILLDTVLATATAGTIGLVLLVLLVPSLYLNRKRWLYAT
jgi:4-hydroxybenzoate polyprenyltransferase